MLPTMLLDKYANIDPDFPEQVFLLTFWENEKENIKSK